ncbi:unnamed protein product [Rhizophagus irregularis]|nr:unnamed protein product [Rhizophagus irregularis]
MFKQGGEKTLRCSAILLNRSLKDDDRRCSGNKIDAIMSILDIGLEFSTLEASGSPSKPVHTHYAGDRNKTAKMLKIILNYIYIKYPGDFEKFRRIKVYGVQIYDHNLYFQRVANFRFKSMDVAGLDYFKYLYAPLRPIQRIYHGSRVLVKVSLPPIMNNVNGWAIGKKKIARAKSIPPGS